MNRRQSEFGRIVHQSPPWIKRATPHCVLTQRKVTESYGLIYFPDRKESVSGKIKSRMHTCVHIHTRVHANKYVHTYVDTELPVRHRCGRVLPTTTVFGNRRLPETGRCEGFHRVGRGRGDRSRETKDKSNGKNKILLRMRHFSGTLSYLPSLHC